MNGVYVNVKDNDSWTPLHAAIHWGQKQAAEILTESGADFNIRNSIVSIILEYSETWILQRELCPFT